MNIINELWKYFDNKKNLSKIELKVYDWINKDNLNSIILDKNIFWFEKTCSYTIMPNYVYNWIKKWVKKNHKDCVYLYD